MSVYNFVLQGEALQARPTGSLWWPEQRVLCVSDLHLGKAERIARNAGTLLPPYEAQDTLGRLRAEIALLHPDHVIALGDSFDDVQAVSALPDDIRAQIAALAEGRILTWIAGNHDPLPPAEQAALPGRHTPELCLGPLTFRHIAKDGATGELSGHYHPKARLAGRRRPAFLIDAARGILPAFGAYTGGLDCDAPVLRDLMAADGVAVLTGRAALAVPLDSQRGAGSVKRRMSPTTP